MCKLPSLLSAAVAPALEQSPDAPADMIACKPHGWSNDGDPQRLDTRGGPWLFAPAVAQLKRSKEAGGSNLGFGILGFKDGFFLVRGVSYSEYGYPPPKTPLNSGPGWAAGPCSSEGTPCP
jgi:hypothetical protein